MAADGATDYKKIEEGSATKADSCPGCTEGWSGLSIAVFIIGNAAFACYAGIVIPQHLLAPNPVLVKVLVAYILFLGVIQLGECLCTGKGTGYGKFGKRQSETGEKSCYGKLMDFIMKPTVPVCVSWWTMEQPAFISALVFFVVSKARNVDGPSPISYCFLLVFMTHYFQRSFIYPCLTRGRPYPALTWFLALIFCSVNGTLQSLELLFGGYYPQDEPADNVFLIRVVIGLLLFYFGMYTNIRSDYILRNLRAPGDKTYKIPRGGMFEYISGANLWGEVVEWLGFAIATGTFAAIAFSLFCFIGIGGRCVATHDWYVQRFGDEYPKQRKKFIPFVW